MKNLLDYDQLTIQEQRQLASFASEYLAELSARLDYAKKRRQRVMLAQRQEENGYIEGDEND